MASQLASNSRLACYSQSKMAVSQKPITPGFAPTLHARPRECARTAPARCSPPEAPTAETADAQPQNGSSGTDAEALPTILNYKEPDAQQRFQTSAKLAFALPWRRFKKGSFLSIKLDGAIAEKKQPRFSPNISMPALCESLRKAAYDPRVAGLYLNIDLLDAGWAKIQEIRTHIEFFKASGKPTVAYMKRGGEKEYFLATACEEIYIPPVAQLSLRGLSVQGQFLRGVLDKAGVEPQIKRIGKYKSAGDQLLRKDMSEAQKEQLDALLDGLYGSFLSGVSEARGKTPEEVEGMLNEGIYDMQHFKAGGWVTDLLYGDQVIDMLGERFGNEPVKKKKKDEKAKAAAAADNGVEASPEPEKKLSAVTYKRYKHVSPSTFGLTGRKVVAVVRAQGNITGGSKPQSGQITAEPLIRQLRELAETPSISGIVLRIDSPGGDALASDLMWREIRRAAEKKPLVATMGDVAASGGYYMGMAAPRLLAHPLTITGSIGVVTGKFNLEGLYDKIGFSKTILSRGEFAEILADNRPFTDAEQALFDESAEFAYRSFRDKAAASRGMEPEEMQELAQGRVWIGSDAIDRNLVDHLGGIDVAVALVKQQAEIPEDEEVTLREVSMDQPSLQQALTSAGLSSRSDIARLVLTDPAFLLGTFGFAVVPLLLQLLPMTLMGPAVTGAAPDGSPQLTLDRMFQSFSSSSASTAVRERLFPQAVMPPISLGGSRDVGTKLSELAKAAGELKDVL
eukprot:jgi/Ulvmu1/9634/UM054_0066.1